MFPSAECTDSLSLLCQKSASEILISDAGFSGRKAKRGTVLNPTGEESETLTVK